MRNTLILINCLLVAACATPREACMQTANRDLTVLRSLIAESEAVLDRGYAVETTDSFVLVSQPCFTKDHPKRWCERPVPVTSKKAVAVDLSAETRKLNGLRKKEQQLRIRTIRDFESCKVTYPE